MGGLVYRPRNVADNVKGDNHCVIKTFTGFQPVRF